MSIRNFTPNALTSLNLAFGCFAIVEIFEGRLESVIYYTLLSGVVDFFDGFSARLLKSTSNIGKDLDSLADMVSFGVVPSLVMYQLLQISSPDMPWKYVAILIAVMSGLRLAKFNNDQRQSDRFYGLPTPANAFLVISLAHLATEGIWYDVVNNWMILLGISIATSALLVVDIPMLAFKFDKYGWKGNEAKYVFLFISLVMGIFFQLVAVPLIIVMYIVGSIFAHLIAPKA
ncbi:CDP-alcohol phosphatidyltransferase family protein [Reichenbachiella sp.]|uniref:CDP-alcohol phosphatidyltransferase family protein n=1 Tax=Reichenbachiella sp. TaxID=2184521 RepID=UPI003B5BDD2C